MLILLGSSDFTTAAGRATLMQGTNDTRTSPSSLRPGHVRTVALAATIVGVVVLPIAAAQATPSHSSKQPSVTGTPATGSPATATAVLPQYCGGTETGFGSQVTAQVCVDNTDGTVTGTVFVGNSGSKPLTVAVNLTRADGSLANMTCTVVAHDSTGSCTTGALNLSAGKGAFDAIAEVVPVNAPVADGVLRADSGSVSPAASPAGGAGTSVAPSPSASASGSAGSDLNPGVSTSVNPSGTSSN
ncbi:hypothetical protein [Actinospica sp.]|uniref:hypothetical protein n=1 Tax=Actinospica sp. TaxID=1872142 RepID=UPI002C1E0A8E|nr:hypothetical protein [Actinospica sp.]HWG24008.1 hypothetical protein [Actinospica sp.]